MGTRDSDFLGNIDAVTKKKAEDKRRKKANKNGTNEDTAIHEEKSKEYDSKEIPKKISKNAVVIYVRRLAFTLAFHYDGLTAADAAEIYEAELADLAWRTIFNAIGEEKEKNFRRLQDFTVYTGILMGLLQKEENNDKEMIRIMQDVYKTMPGDANVQKKILDFLYCHYNPEKGTMEDFLSLLKRQKRVENTPKCITLDDSRPRGRNNNGRYAYRNDLRGNNAIHYRRRTPTSNTIRGLRMINAVQEKIRREKHMNPTHCRSDIKEEFWC